MFFLGHKVVLRESNIIETERKETSRYSNKAYFEREYFLYFREIKFLKVENEDDIHEKRMQWYQE